MPVKKLFWAIIVVVQMAACFGGSDDDNLDITAEFKSTQNIYEDLVRNKDGSITYYAIPWGGLVGTFGSYEKPADWSAYEGIVFEFDKPTEVNTQLTVNEKLMTWCNMGNTTLEGSFGGNDVSAVRHVALQAWDSTTITIKRIYLTKATAAKTSITLWKGKCEMGNWTGGFEVTPDKFEDAEPGNELELIYHADTSDPSVTYWEFKTIYASQNIPLEGNIHELNDWGCALVSHLLTSYRITLSAKDVVNLKKYGLYVNGYYTIATQCNLLQ